MHDGLLLPKISRDINKPPTMTTKMATGDSSALPQPLLSDAIVAKALEEKKMRLPLSSLSINAPVPPRKSSRLGDTKSTENAPSAKLRIDTSSAIIAEEPKGGIDSNLFGLSDHEITRSQLAASEVSPLVMAFAMKLQTSVSTLNESSSTSTRPQRKRKPNILHNVPEGKKAKITLAMHIKKYGGSHQIKFC
jgi:hypothetical protein